MKVRSASLDDIMTELIQLKGELNSISKNYNQMVRQLHSLNHYTVFKPWLKQYEPAHQVMLSKMDEIKRKIALGSDVWLQS